MKARYILLGPVFFTGLYANGQVTIADPGFAAALELVVPDAINGDQLDPAHPSVAALDSLTASSMEIISVDGIQYFTGLLYLDLSGNSNLTLPTTLPASLTYIDLSSAGLTSLPNLPGGLVHLNVGSNYGLSSLPPLPASLTLLSIGSTNISSLANLPDGLLTLFAGNSAVTIIQGLPESLESLYLWNSEGISIVDLPDGLRSLDISQCDLTEWPVEIAQLTELVTLISSWNDWSSATIVLPANLQFWGSENSSITVLPDLPASLTYLDVYNNDIAVLPPLPPNLVHLSIAGSPISAPLDPVPASLEYLDMGLTQIPEVGVLPEGLTYLDCSYSWMLTCLPNVPSGLQAAGFNGSILCLPEPLPPGVEALSAWPNWPPVCTNFDVLCAMEPYVEGHTYHDINNNGLADDGGAMVPFGQLLVEPGGIQFGSTSSGSYYCHLQPGSYTVEVVPGPYQVATSGTIGVDLPTPASIVSGSDHGVTFTQDMADLQVQVVPQAPPVPGFNTAYAIHYQNVGSLATTASITLEVDPLLSYVSSTPPPSDVQPGLITWEVSVDGLDVDGLIAVILVTSVGTALGAEVSLTATVFADGLDANPDNDSDRIDEVVIGAYDPNDKRVAPASLTPAEVLAGTPVRYTVRFQNTGTAPAQLVRVSDSLDYRLDLASFRFLNTSHPSAWYIENGVLSVIYQGINLPDSISNEPGSHGYFSFEIKPTQTLLLGEAVANVANIYFDYNEPVITAPAVFAVEEAMALYDVRTYRLTVSPNPANDFVTVRGADMSGNRVLRLHDAAGRMMATAMLREGVAVLDIRGLAAGSYALSIDGEPGSVRVMKR